MTTTLIFAALAAFACGATAGIFLAARHFLRKRLPVSVALFHGLGGATGFALVLFAVVRDPAAEMIRRALYLFIAAIALGCVNLLFHVRRVRHRTSLIVMHALSAVSGVGTLGYAVLQPTPKPPLVAPPPAPAVVQPERPMANVAPATPGTAAEPPNVAAIPVPKGSDDSTPAARLEPGLDPTVRRALEHPIFFDRRSVAIAGRSSAAVDAVAAALKAHAEVTEVEVQGHADERGGDDPNLALTRLRAQAVVDSLVVKGVSPRRLRVAGYGARCPSNPACGGSDPPASCHTTEAWARDRRVVVVALRAGGAAVPGPLVCARAADLIPTEDRPYQASQ